MTAIETEVTGPAGTSTSVPEPTDESTMTEITAEELARWREEAAESRRTTGDMLAELTTTVTIPIVVQLERVEWDFILSENYYVMVNGHYLGSVGRNDNDSKWACTINSAQSSKITKREFTTRARAVAAVVRANAALFPSILRETS